MSVVVVGDNRLDGATSRYRGSREWCECAYVSDVHVHAPSVMTVELIDGEKGISSARDYNGKD